MKCFLLLIEELKQEIDVRIENYKDAVETYRTEFLRMRDVYLNEGFRADISEQKSKEYNEKLRQKINAIEKELEHIIIALGNIDPTLIRKKLDSVSEKSPENDRADLTGRKRTKGVLIVDDTGLIRTLIKDILLNVGVAVAGEADNGKIALEKYKELLPELVIMDVLMPGGCGIEALANIKAYDPDAKVVMCSQSHEQATVDEAIKLGALHFILKPFKTELLIAIIKKLINN